MKNRELDCLPGDEPEKMQRGMQYLLRWQAARYSMGERGSMAQETAVELARSLWYIVRCSGVDPAQLAQAEPAQLRDIYHAGVKTLRRRRDAVQAFCIKTAASAPAYANAPMRETLTELQKGLLACDLDFFAEKIDAAVDYPLCAPVEETLAGIDYAAQYLQRLAAENALLTSFEAPLCEQLLDSFYPGWEDAPVNLCEPVIAAAAGCVLAGGDPARLEVTDADRGKLAARFAAAPDALPRQLAAAAGKLCRCMGWQRPAQCACATQIITQLAPRISAACTPQGLRGVFVPL